MIFTPQPPAHDRKPRHFSLSSSFLDEYKVKEVKWGPVGEFTYKRTYSRRKDDGTTEEWWETVKRVVEGIFNYQKSWCRMQGTRWDEPKAQKSAQDMYDRIFTFKFTPPGRGLWMVGTKLVEEKGSAALNNCSFVSTDDIDTDFSAPFCFLMDMSMLGVGVGGDVRGAGKVKIQVPRLTDTPFVVEDSREGWVDLIKTVLDSFVGKGYFPTTIDYSRVRKKGEPILGFGGTASGSAPLRKLVSGVARMLLGEDNPMATVEWHSEGDIDHAKFQILNEDPRRITSSQIVDIFNFVGKCVVAGGVRRTSEIMFGEIGDEDFIQLKSDETLRPLYARKAELEDELQLSSSKELEQELSLLNEAIQSHPLLDRRWASNNSIFGHPGMDYTGVARRIAENGEPGILWLGNARAFGRLGDPANNRDYRVMGSNPCGEQSLEPWECCNLVETYPAHHDSLDDYLRTIKTAYLYGKTITLIPTHDVRTNNVMNRNRRIGLSQSGIVQAIAKFGRTSYLNWCEEAYQEVQKLDKQYSDWLGIPLSIKTTSVKPSGSVSLLCGATPGIHFPHSEYYIRRIRVADTSPLVQAARDAGYHVEPDMYADDTSVVSFPVQEQHFLKSKSRVSIWEQFALAASLQEKWADNQVSVTVTFNSQEAGEIASCLEVYESKLKSVSLLPLNDHSYAQAPYEEIDAATYAKMTSNLRPMNFNPKIDTHDSAAEDKFCDGGSCTVSFSSE